MSQIDVMIVDDDRAICEFVEVILAERGYRVRSALSGREAMEVLKGGKPNVLLLDLILPEMDGWELAKAMRDSPDLKNVPVVVMSAHSDGLEEAESIGAARFLRKPFDLDELFSCVATYAGRKG